VQNLILGFDLGNSKRNGPKLRELGPVNLLKSEQPVAVTDLHDECATAFRPSGGINLSQTVSGMDGDGK
jgi:hypothetical protein